MNGEWCTLARGIDIGGVGSDVWDIGGVVYEVELNE